MQLWMVVVPVGALVALIAIFLAVSYNKLIRQRNLVSDAWAGIDVQLTRRANLIPNLVKIVQAYAAHERSTLEDVTLARTETVDASEPDSAEHAANHLDGSLRHLLAVAEAYPDLKANANFLDLQDELANVEEDIAFSRRYYNAIVRKYNDAQQTFPTVLVAALFGHRSALYFQADADARSGPQTRFTDGVDVREGGLEPPRP